MRKLMTKVVAAVKRPPSGQLTADIRSAVYHELHAQETAVRELEDRLRNRLGLAQKAHGVHR